MGPAVLPLTTAGHKPGVATGVLVEKSGGMLAEGSRQGHFFAFALYLDRSRDARSLPRGFTGHVVDSRSPDRLGRIPIDQCSPSAGFPARCMHPIRSIEKDYRFETDEASFAGANFTAGGCELRIEPVGRAR